MKIGLEYLPPVTSLGVRFLLAAALMMFVAPFLRRIEGGDPPPFWLSCSVAITQFSVTYGIVYWSINYLPSGLTSLLWAVFPLMMALAGHFWLPNEKLTLRQVGGFGLGFVGVVLLFRSDLSLLGADATPAALVLLLSPLICALGTVVIKQRGANVSSALLTRNGLIIGSLLLIAYALVVERDVEANWNLVAWMTVLYLTVVGMCVTFGIYFWLLRYAAATRLSLVAYVTPCIALFLGWLFRDEPIYWHTAVGAGLVVVGIAIVVRK